MATITITVDEFVTKEELTNLANNMVAGFNLWNLSVEIRI